MAGAEAAGAKLLYRNVGFNSYGFLNATESFLSGKPDVAQTVVDAYEHARAWAAAIPRETAQFLADESGLDLAIATKVITERTQPGCRSRAWRGTDRCADQDRSRASSTRCGGPVRTSIDAALATIVNDTFVAKADPSRIP